MIDTRTPPASKKGIARICGDARESTVLQCRTESCASEPSSHRAIRGQLLIEVPRDAHAPSLVLCRESTPVANLGLKRRNELPCPAEGRHSS